MVEFLVPHLNINLWQVKAAFAPGVAAEDAPEAFGAANEEAVFLDGEARVHAARGSESAKAPWKAVSEPGMVGREDFLIEPNESVRKKRGPVNGVPFLALRHHTPMKLGFTFTPL